MCFCTCIVSISTIACTITERNFLKQDFHSLLSLRNLLQQIWKTMENQLHLNNLLQYQRMLLKGHPTAWRLKTCHVKNVTQRRKRTLWGESRMLPSPSTTTIPWKVNNLKRLPLNPTLCLHLHHLHHHYQILEENSPGKFRETAQLFFLLSLST